MARILVVEDRHDTAALLHTALKKIGHETLAAGDGEEGLRKIREEQPDLVILDLMMPKMTGIEVLEELKHDEGYRPKILVLTAANFDIPEEKEVMKHEADLVLSKPLKIDELQRIVETLLRDALRNGN